MFWVMKTEYVNLTDDDTDVMFLDCIFDDAESASQYVVNKNKEDIDNSWMYWYLDEILYTQKEKDFFIKRRDMMSKGKVYVFHTLNNDWCCGKTAFDQVWAPTKEEAIKLYKKNTGFKGKVVED